MSLDQGYAKLVGFDRSFGIERWYSISNIGFYFDSGLVEMLYVGFSFYKSGVWYVGCLFHFDPDSGNMLVSVSILTHTWVICWFRFRFWLRLGYYVGFGFDFDSKNCEMLHIDFNIDSDLGNMLVLVSILTKKNVICCMLISILTQTWTKCWFRFRFWLRLEQSVGFGFDFDYKECDL